MRHWAILVYPIHLVPHCGLFERLTFMNNLPIWLAASMTLALGGCATSGAFAPRSSEPIVIERHQGVWLSQGYGYVLDIGSDRVRLFHLAGDICVEEKEIESSILPHLDRVRAASDDDEMVLWSVLDPFEYTFVRRPVLPAPCRPPTANTAIGNFEAFSAFYAEHYTFFNLYGVDWPARVAKARSTISNDTARALRYPVLPVLENGWQSAS
jgi:carboxyl-terminal processing protease